MSMRALIIQKNRSRNKVIWILCNKILPIEDTKIEQNKQLKIYYHLPKKKTQNNRIRAFLEVRWAKASLHSP